MSNRPIEPWTATAIIIATVLGFIALVLFSVKGAMGQDLPRPNTTLHTGIGVAEIVTDAIPGEEITFPRTAPAVAAAPPPAVTAQAPALPVDAAGQAYDPAAYYRALGEFARERAQHEEITARRYARMSAQMGGGSSSAMATIMQQTMAGCSARDGGGDGFWASIGNRMGRSKECREQQTTARMMMCTQVAVELHEPNIMQYCAQLAENDNKWIGFWTQALRAGVSIAGIHYGAGVLSEVIGLGRHAVDVGVGTAQQAIQTPAPAPVLVPPTIVETPPPQIVNPEVINPVVIDGGGGG